MAPVDPAPNPPRRMGPRPLGLHLATAVTTWLNCATALPLSSSGLRGSSPRNGAVAGLPWHPSLRDQAAALGRELAGADPEAFGRAVVREVRLRLDELDRGISRYRHHPYRRDLSAPAAVWRQGTTRLLDYGSGASDAAAPLLVVPSLVNRGYILDLWAGRSLMRSLAAAGFRPFLVDWDAPGPAERAFGLTAYIAGRLGAALDHVMALTGRRPVLIGYCMGGLLALALARIRPGDVAGLVLLATPWDFHADKAELGRGVARAIAPSLPLFERIGAVPTDLLQGLFAALDPFLVVRKFRAFARLDPDSERAREFVALEDWLNDGVPMAAPVARECLLGWYGENTPARGEWQVAGQAIRPEEVTVPALVVVPEQDRIVPPPSARRLAQSIEGATVVTAPFGHIGMVASNRAPVELWPEIVAWLAGRLATPKPAGL